MRLIFIAIAVIGLIGCASSAEVHTVGPTDKQTLTRLWREADVAYQQHEWSKSYQLYFQVSEQITDVDVEFRKGVSAFRISDIKQAEISFEKALKIDPSHRKSLFNLALINMSRGYTYLHNYINISPTDKQSEDIVDILQALEKFSNH